MRSVKKILSNTFLILGTFIGGGLATGKELATFFCAFGNRFYIPCIISLITFLIVLLLINKINFTKANKFLTFAFFLFRLIICSTMISALKSVALLTVNPIIIYIILLVLSFFLMFCNFKQISKIFNIIIPIVFIILISISLLSFQDLNSISLTNRKVFLMIINGISYSAFNAFLLVFIIKKCFSSSTQKEINISIALITLLIAFLLVIMCLAITTNNLQNTDIPMLFLSISLSPKCMSIMIVAIILAIISTFLGINYDLSNTFKQVSHLKDNFITNCILFSFYLIISNFGIDILINYGYRFLGIAAFIYFVFEFIKNKRIKT